MKTSLTREMWDSMLGRYLGSTKASMVAAIECTLAAISHYAATGDLVYCQSFYDNMPKDFHRKAAFIKWLTAHAPVKVTKDKATKRDILKKDKESEAFKSHEDSDLLGAAKKPFWEFAPDKEDIYFDYSTALAAILAAANKYVNGKRYHADNEETKLKLTKIVHILEGEIQAVESPSFGDGSKVEEQPEKLSEAA